MALSNYKSSQIELNVPNKVLGTSISSVTGTEYWDHANGSADPWYSGSGTKKYYRWEVTFSVTAQTHGSHLTRDDFAYNGLDVVVGDWLATASSGLCWKIVSISSKDVNNVTCVVEDWLRYNTFRVSTGNGAPSSGSAVVFSLNEKGIPMLDPLPSTAAAIFYPTVASRFEYLNPQQNYVLEQSAHGLEKGDIVAVSNVGFTKANTATMGKMIGVVTESGPGPNQFMILPNNQIIDFDPSIPGSQGDYVYVSSTGEFTTSDTGKIAFLKVQDSISTVLTGTVDGPELPDQHTITLNGQTVLFDGDGSNVNVSTMAANINSVANTNVVANTTPTPTVVTSDTDSVAYGLVGGYTPFSAYIDSGSGNTLINFTTNTAGQAQYSLAVGIAEDMAKDINDSTIANLTASVTGSNLLRLTESNGNAINIYNGNADTGGYNFVGASNISGLPATTVATSADKLRLTRDDGGEILIFEDSTLFQDQTGIFSAHTGSVPLAMNIEQGVRTGGTTVVGSTSARDALAPAAGDQAYVTNKGDGEWGLYLYTGSAWVQVSDADSANVDAKTITVNFEMPVGGFGTSTTTNMGNISPGRKIQSVSVEVHTAFSGHSGGSPNIEVGTIADPDVYCDSPSNDLTEAVSYICNPEYVYPNSNTQDQTIRARCNHYNATAGNVTVILTYV